MPTVTVTYRSTRGLGIRVTDYNGDSNDLAMALTRHGLRATAYGPSAPEGERVEVDLDPPALQSHGLRHDAAPGVDAYDLDTVLGYMETLVIASSPMALAA